MSSYLELLNLTREPFSNSPDPDAYYRTPTHEDCLNRLEIAIRLRRGLNVVLGEVGTGKSTLCRCLLRSLNEQSGIDVFLLLDAGFEDADEFVRHLCELFAGQRPPEGVARRECISVIQNRVFDKALEQNRNLVLFIDEGQKLSPAALEVLRELLNFETNTEKLLQIVIFGQPELAQIIEGMPNFKDRINEYLYLKPLSMRESIRLVRHRLRLAGGQRAERLFSLGSLIALHRASRGKPRQLMRLGHQMLLALLVGNRTTVTGCMVWAQVARNGSDVENRWGRWLVVALALICVAGGYRWMPEAVKDDAHARLEAVVSGVLGWLPEAEKADTAGTAGKGRAAGDDAVRRAASREAVPQPLPPDEAPPAVPEKAESSTAEAAGGQGAEEKQVGGLLKAEPPLLQRPRHQLLYIDAAVVELAVAGDLLPIHHFFGDDVGDLGQARQNALAVEVAEAALDVVSHIVPRVNAAVLQGLGRQRFNLRGDIAVVWIARHRKPPFFRSALRTAERLCEMCISPI